MKKRIKISILIIVLGITGLIVSVLLQQNYYKETKVTPDSGNDFSYDGGSDSGGSSSNSGSDYGSGGESDPLIGFIFIGIMILIFGAFFLWDYRNGKKYQKEIAEIKNKLITLGYNPDELCKQAFYVYLNVQYAWMNFDYKTLRYYLSDELYNNYVELLEQKKMNGERNIMEDITQDKLANIESFELVDDKLILVLDMTVVQRDYIVDTQGRIIRGNRNFNTVRYKITYEVSKNKDNVCPNCGAKLSQASSEICPYCGSVSINKNHGLIMIKKQIISQG